MQELADESGKTVVSSTPRRNCAPVSAWVKMIALATKKGRLLVHGDGGGRQLWVADVAGEIVAPRSIAAGTVLSAPAMVACWRTTDSMASANGYSSGPRRR